MFVQQVHVHHEEPLVLVFAHCHPSFIELYQGLQLLHCGLAVYSLHVLQFLLHKLVVTHLKHLDSWLFRSSSLVFIDYIKDSHPFMQD